MRSVAVFALLCFAAIQAKPYANFAETNCGYASCPAYNPDTLNVHVIPHSHDDVGWLKTVDQYYYGSRTNIQRAGVQYIIDSVVEALSQNPERRFIQVETAFFHKWWVEQSDEKKEKVRELVENGRLEFIGGAWSMNDEAASHYHSVIDQFTFGLGILKDTFGECGRPKIGWQIDPFGHSKEQASIFAGLGYDGLFFSRLDWRDKGKRMATRTPEMIWQSSKSLGDDSNLFTSVLYNHYSAPSGFCFDILCSEDPIIDDINSTEYNYEEKVSAYANFIRGEAPNYPTNNIHITMGDDFNYQDALSYFHNMDKLIKGFEVFPQLHNGVKLNVFYSTPSCYVKAVNEAASAKKQAFAVKTDDFFPYASDPHAYWTGYFTSRPTSKRFERETTNLLQIAKQLAAKEVTTADNTAALVSLEEAVGIMQHHDAITGTEKQHVADDYARIMTEAVTEGSNQIDSLISKALNKDGTNFKLGLQSCLLANISVCAQSLEDDFLVAVYNPLSRNVNTPVKLPVDGTSYIVTDPAGDEQLTQVTEPINAFTSEGTYHHAKYELVFIAEKVPALGVKVFFVKNTGLSNPPVADTSSERYRAGNTYTGFTIDSLTGLLSSVVINGNSLPVSQQLMYYVGAVGDNTAFERRASGAYIFRPSTSKPEAVAFTNKVTTVTYKGPVFDEVHQTYSSWAKQVIRVYKNTDHIEFDWLVGPIDTSNNEPKEVISRFTATMSSGSKFFTDSNGREMIERTRNFRDTYDYTNEEPVSGNYYPVTSRISIRNGGVELSVLNDRAQGGTSLKSGEVELMLHRRLLRDDAFGVGESLNEMEFGGVGILARGTHYLTLTGGNFAPLAAVKKLEQEKSLAAWTFVSKAIPDVEKKIKFEFSGLAKVIPENVQILTLQPLSYQKNALLLRLEHLYEKDDASPLAAPATVNIQDLLTDSTIVSLVETTLGGNQNLEDRFNFDWILGQPLATADYSSEFDTSRDITYQRKNNVQAPNDFNIVLSPRQIRTFILNVQ